MSNLLEGVQGGLKDKRVLVTGAAGFVGRRLVEELVLAGAHVSGFGRGGDTFDPNTVRWINGSFDDPMALTLACEDQEIVFHLLNSSTPDSATRQPVGDIVGNLVPSIQLIEAAVKANVQRFIFFSSGGTVYGNANASPIPETSGTAPRSAYGISKLSIENYLRLLSDLNGMEYRILRLSNPYGPGQSPQRKQGMVAAALGAILSNSPFELWGSGAVVRDFIYIDDVISAALTMAVHEGEHRIFNVGSGIGRSISQVLEDLQLICPEYNFSPIRRSGRPVDVPSNVLDISRLTSVGWSPLVSWEEGLARTKTWMQADHHPVRV